jgi:hypothetical protein
MKYLTNYCSVLPHFCCNGILYYNYNVDYSHKNHTNRVSWWWYMTDWWWKVGFTPRAIRHVCPYWHLSSSGVIYIWVLCLEGASWGTHTLGTFQKYPFFRPPLTTSLLSMPKRHVYRPYIYIDGLGQPYHTCDTELQHILCCGLGETEMWNRNEKMWLGRVKIEDTWESESIDDDGTLFGLCELCVGYRKGVLYILRGLREISQSVWVTDG